MDASGKKHQKQQVATPEKETRLIQEALNGALARKRCHRCTTMGLWTCYSTKGKVRYIRCKACGYCDKLPIIVEETTNETA